MLKMADVNCGLVRKESKRLQSLLPLCATGVWGSWSLWMVVWIVHAVGAVLATTIRLTFRLKICSCLMIANENACAPRSVGASSSRWEDVRFGHVLRVSRPPYLCPDSCATGQSILLPQVLGQQLRKHHKHQL